MTSLEGLLRARAANALLAAELVAARERIVARLRKNEQLQAVLEAGAQAEREGELGQALTATATATSASGGSGESGLALLPQPPPKGVVPPGLGLDCTSVFDVAGVTERDLLSSGQQQQQQQSSAIVAVGTDQATDPESAALSRVLAEGEVRAGGSAAAIAELGKVDHIHMSGFHFIQVSASNPPFSQNVSQVYVLGREDAPRPSPLTSF
jgi:hypothetical protein